MPIFLERVVLGSAATLVAALVIAIALHLFDVKNVIDLGLPIMVGALVVVLIVGSVTGHLLHRYNRRKSPIAPVPSADVTPVELPDGRILIRQPPAYLVGLCVGLTSIQIEAKTAPYIGNWLRPSGRVRQVFTYGSDETCVWLRPDSERRPDMESLKLHFTSERWAGHLHLLNVEDRIVVMGKIKRIDTYEITLTDCELVDC